MSPMQQSRERLTNEQKYRICMQNMQFPRMSQVELGEWARREFNLPKAVKQKTISNILNSKDKVFNAYTKGNTQGKSNIALKIPQLDDDILEYIRAMNARSYPVNRATVTAYAKVITNTKHLYGENSSIGLTSANIVSELEKIEKLYEPYDTRDIMNFDETGIYYEQHPTTRTICEKPMGGSKERPYKGHPIVIERKQTSKTATKKHALYRKTTCIGQSHYVEYNTTPSAWMTTKVFRKYIKRLNSSFVYAKRKVAILENNASLHKLTEEFSNIKLIFLPANTTSKLQPLNADTIITGIIANLKAHFCYYQYFRAANKHIAGVDLNHAEKYRMDEVDALFFLADSWLKIEPQTIKNCWDHTKIVDFKFDDREEIETKDAIRNFNLPVSDALVRRFNEIIPDLPGNRDGDGNPLVTELGGLDLAADESDLIVFRPEPVEIHEDKNDGENSEQPLVVEEK
ncbi:hypothetical protein G6F42_009882 [Rhizopus arrhizus]|nr:hypothetical protein G6F42_009882 [Rhizopus arrhizus]